MPDLFSIYFFYGLAFFSMGLGIMLELGHAVDERVRHSLRPLAAFGLIHGLHEWLEMFEIGGFLRGDDVGFKALKLALIAFSFFSLAAFGAFLLAQDEKRRRIGLLLPLFMAGIWGLGSLVLRGYYGGDDLWDSAHAWTRYTLGIPASIFAFIGLIYQQRAFRLQGMAQFGQDSLWAAVAFLWYGLIGQAFPHNSPLFPSNSINQDLFYSVFGFPIQLVRASAAVLVAVFVLRFMRSFEVETRQRIADLQDARLRESQEREALRGEMLRRIVSAQEAERQRIARELHDATGQALTAIGLGLRGVAGSIQNERAVENLHHLEETVTLALVDLQNMIADLRPSHLDDLGLNATLRWYAGEVKRRVPLDVVVEIAGHSVEVPAEVKTCIFRIAQEAITNVIKHAQATTVKVEMDYLNDGIKVQINDDGVGFDPNQIADSGRASWGLVGMNERASLLGGECMIFSQAGQGTSVVATIPYQTENSGNEG